MNRPIRIEPEAAAELDEAGGWYDDKRPGLGMQFLEAIDVVLTTSRDGPVLPLQSQVLPRPAGPAGSRWALPLSCVYLETTTAIRILAVAHDRREPGYWQGRTQK